MGKETSEIKPVMVPKTPNSRLCLGISLITALLLATGCDVDPSTLPTAVAPQATLPPPAATSTVITCQDVKVRRVYEVLPGAKGQVEQDQLVTSEEVNTKFQDLDKKDAISLIEVHVVSALSGATVFGFCADDQGKQLGYYQFDGAKWNRLTSGAELTPLCPSSQAPEAEPGSIQPKRITAPAGAIKVLTIPGYKNCKAKGNRADWQDAGIPNPNVKPASTIEAKNGDGWKTLQSGETFDFKSHNIDFKLVNNSNGYVVKFNQANFEKMLVALKICGDELRYPRVGISFMQKPRQMNGVLSNGVIHWPGDGTWNDLINFFVDPWQWIELSTETSEMRGSNDKRNEVGAHEVAHACQLTKKLGEDGYKKFLETARTYMNAPYSNRGKDKEGKIISQYEVDAYTKDAEYSTKHLPLFITWEKTGK